MAKKKITQLDLFSGIGGFHLGFEKAGYKVKSYFSEIDKHAVAVYKHQFKDSEYVGSVTNVRGEQLPKIDLITFGSPCQDFSLAGKRKGMGGERSSLVLEAIRLIDECRPSVFVWENVKGTFSSNNGADFAAILQAFTNIGGYRLEWQLLNTSWVLPQNRERLYLVGYSTKPGRNWRGVFPIGEGAGENTTMESYRKTFSKCLTARGQEQLHSGLQLIKEPVELYRKGDGKPLRNDIAPTLTGAGGNSGGNHSQMACLKVKSATKQGYEVAEEGDSINLSNPDSKTRRGRVGKQTAQTLDTMCNQAVVTPKIVGYTKDAKEKVTDRHFKDTAGTIHTASGSGGNTDQFVQDMEIVTCIGGLQKNAAHFEEKSPALTSAMGMGGGHIPIIDQPNYRIRRLTPIECERLQGFPDNHTAYGMYDGEVKKVSNTQRYKQCGNAVTVDIVALVAEAVKPLFK